MHKDLIIFFLMNYEMNIPKGGPVASWHFCTKKILDNLDAAFSANACKYFLASCWVIIRQKIRGKNSLIAENIFCTKCNWIFKYLIKIIDSTLKYFLNKFYIEVFEAILKPTNPLIFLINYFQASAKMNELWQISLNSLLFFIL